MAMDDERPRWLSRWRVMQGASEWLSEEDMPDYNVDGTPMVNGIDLNGRPYGHRRVGRRSPVRRDGL